MLIAYNEERQRFEAQASYAERNEANPLLKSAGFSFDYDGAKVWHSQNYYPKYGKKPRTWEEQIAVAAKLSDYLNEKARQLVGSAVDVAKAAQAQKQASLDASRATDANVEVPKPEGLDYLPYQKAGIAYAIQRINTLIADEMGLGKTIQAIGVINSNPAIKHILIICPAKLKLNWMKETVKWDVYKRSIGVVTRNNRKARIAVEKYGQGRATILSKEGPFSQDLIIANFDVVADCAHLLRAEHWHVLVVDECHKIKNPKAQRTQFILGRKESTNKKTKEVTPAIEPINADRNLFLTGTPIVNRPLELWPIIQRFDPSGLGANFFKFAMRYCGATHNGYGWDFKGASHLDELQDYLRSTFMVRRLKSQVLTELPPKRRQIVPLEAGEDLDEILQKENAEFDKLTAAGLSYDEIPFTEASAIRQASAIAKIPQVIEFVDDTLEEVDKVVVFAHHKEVISQLKAKYGSAAVVVNGDSTDVEAIEAQDRFQQDPEIKVFIGSILASGVGLTLTAAKTVVFAEMDWVPGNNSQAEDRCHRIGQHDGVNVYYLVLDGSVDARIVELVLEKQAVIDQALDTRVEKNLPEVGAPASKPEYTPDGVTPNSVNEKSEEVYLDQATAKAVHEALRILAGMCDGAFQEDNCGFNKFDTRFGHDLANRFSLTPKQAAAGQKLVRKYQRQLSEDLLLRAGVEPIRRTA